MDIYTLTRETYRAWAQAGMEHEKARKEHGPHSEQARNLERMREALGRAVQATEEAERISAWRRWQRDPAPSVREKCDRCGAMMDRGWVREISDGKFLWWHCDACHAKETEKTGGN